MNPARDAMYFGGAGAIALWAGADILAIGLLAIAIIVLRVAMDGGD